MSGRRQTAGTVVLRDYNGRVYSQFDIALLQAVGVGARPRKLKSAKEVLEAAQ